MNFFAEAPALVGLTFFAIAVFSAAKSAKRD